MVVEYTDSVNVLGGNPGRAIYFAEYNSILLGGRKCNNQNYCYNIKRKSGEES